MVPSAPEVQLTLVCVVVKLTGVGAVNVTGTEVEQFGVPIVVSVNTIVYNVPAFNPENNTELCGPAIDVAPANNS
jgi:hypothetical protein